MRIIQTVNDTIRLLFNPKSEIFELSDFLLVRDCSENFLAQVVEVYDDKFDQEANVAKIKLIYRIVNGNEIKPYDNYTPSRECEVAKIKQSEIEKCINLNKKTIEIGKAFKSKEKMFLNTDFFDNSCVVFADKFEQTNRIFETLAPKLSKHKNVLILDFSGSCKIENAKNFTTGENFKLPLSSSTIDYIKQKSLMRAKLETQAVLGDVFEEVKKFLLTNEEDYIPYQRFIKVVQNQCKLTPSVELLVLISWLKKYAQAGIFAKNKRESEALFNSLKKNKITILDLSNLKTEWQKEHLEYISNTIKEDVFVLARLNENNINNDILNSIYLKKKNISFIPSFAYGYKKASYIMEFARNYVLLPALNPRRDFLHANFQIQSLNKESFMIFGEDTKDFIFTLELETPIKPKDKNEDKEKLFISLNLQLEDMTPLELRPNNFEVRPRETRPKRLQEEISLSDVLGQKDEEEGNIEEKVAERVEEAPVAEESQIYEPEEQIAPANVINEDELDYFVEDVKEEIIELPKEAEKLPPEMIKPNNIKDEPKTQTDEKAPKEETAEEKAEPASEAVIDIEPIETKEKDEPAKEQNEPVQIKEERKKETKEANAQNIEKEEKEETGAKTAVKKENAKKKSEKEHISEIKPDETPEDKEKPNKESFKEALSETLSENKNESGLSPIAENEPEKPLKAPKKTKKAQMPKIKEKETKTGEDEIKELEKITLPAGELAAFAKSSENAYTEEEIVEETMDEAFLDAIDEANAQNIKKEEKEPEDETKAPVIEETKQAVSTIIDEVVNTKIEDKIKDEETQKALDDLNKEKLKEAETAPVEMEEDIDKKFEEIINSENETQNKQKLEINEKVSIDLEKIKKEITPKERKLPVFDDDTKEETETQSGQFKQGDKVVHEKYGTGEILKVINYGQRCLLQIEFDDIGKRLLDPKIAKLKPADEI